MVMAVASLFEYEPLQGPRNIRVLHIHPGAPEDPLSCHLEHVDLGLNPTYEAISYVWGNPSFSHSILCDENPIAVTKSLDTVLHRLRLRDQQRTVWIDGVCINQGDVEERGHQVRLMGDVYKRAQRVVIWLGEDENGQAEGAFKFCVTISEIPERELSWRNIRRNLITTQMGGALRALSESAWFQRTWVLQELVLASSAVVMWGDSEVSWAHIHSAIATLSKNWDGRYFHIGMGLTKIETFIEIKDKSDDSSIDFLRALRWTHGLHCVDKHDKIYALIGLLSDSKIEVTSQLAKFIRPNYERSVEQVYEDFSIAAAKLDMVGDLIRSVRHGSDLEIWVEGSTPSWVPNWTRLPKRGRSNRPFETLLGRLGHDNKLLIDPEKPFLAGPSIHLAKVQAVSEEIGYSDIEVCFSAITDFWQKHIRFYVDHVSPEKPSEGIEFRFVEAITEGSDAFSGASSSENVFERYALALYTIFEDTELARNQESERHGVAQALLERWGKETDSPLDAQKGPNFDNELQVLALPDGQRLFITDTGHIGLGPAAMRAGDDVKFLPATFMPMVLRFQDSFYQLVGGCYVAGLMDLESDELLGMCKSLNVEKIEIR